MSGQTLEQLQARHLRLLDAREELSEVIRALEEQIVRAGDEKTLGVRPINRTYAESEICRPAQARAGEGGEHGR